MHTMTIVTGGRTYQATAETLPQVLRQIDADIIADARMREVLPGWEFARVVPYRGDEKTGGR